MVVTVGWKVLGILGTAIAASGLVASGLSHAQSPLHDQPMVFEWRTIDRGGEAIVAAGVISPDTAVAFGNFVRSRKPPPGTVVVISSDGGDLDGGLELGRALRSLGLDTTVGEVIPSGSSRSEVTAGRCVSACALAFLGGVERSLHAGSEYGVHQLRMECIERSRSEQRYPWLPLPGARYCPGFEEAMSAFQSAQGAITAYVAEMGADPLLVAEMAEVSASALRFLNRDELAGFRVTWRTGRDSPAE